MSTVSTHYPNKWNPYSNAAASPPASGSKSSSNQNKLLLAISGGILLFAILAVVFLAMVYLEVKDYSQAIPITATTNTPGTTTTTATGSCQCEGFSGKNLFFPYGVENGDWLYEDVLAYVYTVDHTIGYKLLGASGQLAPIGIKLVQNKGTFNIGPMESGKVSKTTYAKISVAAGGLYADPGLVQNQEIYHRKARYSDITMFKCLFPQLDIKEAYVFTWIKATLNGTLEVVGSFQAVVIFGKDSTTYLIRNYENDIVDISGVTEMFKITESVTVKKLYDKDKAADVKGKRQIFILSDPCFGDHLVMDTEQENGPCPQ